MSGKRGGSVRGVLLFVFDTPCKVAHHACVLYRAFVHYVFCEKCIPIFFLKSGIFLYLRVYIVMLEICALTSSQ